MTLFVTMADDVMPSDDGLGQPLWITWMSRTEYLYIRNWLIVSKQGNYKFTNVLLIDFCVKMSSENRDQNKVKMELDMENCV